MACPSIAAVAQYEIGQALALQGQPRLAMEEFQQVRNRFPQSPWAQPALERTTALYRLYGGPKPSFAADPAFSLAGGGDTLAAIEKYGVGDGISYVSTGGGAFLEFVEGKPLPAVVMLETRARQARGA